MKEKDILKMLDREVDHLVPSTPSERITSTPIRVPSGANAAVKPKKSFVKTRAFQVMCASLVCVAVLTGVLVPVLMMNGGGGQGGGDIVPVPDNMYADSTFVSVDINPSLNYITDNKSKVINVISRNHDGDVLLSNGFKETLLGKDIVDAVNMTVDQATKLGYIDATSRAGQGEKVNAVRINVASDNSSTAKKVLEDTKKSVSEHLKNKGILMVVGGKEIDKSLVLKDSGIESIEEWNEINKDRESYFYVSNSIGKTEGELADTFKNDFIGKYVEDSFDELLEDIEDMLSVVADIMELEDELDDIKGIENIGKGYWEYKELIRLGICDNEEIIEIVRDITDKIDEYNDIFDEKEEEKDLVKASNVLEKIARKSDLEGLKIVYHAYFDESPLTHKTGRDRIEELVEDVADDMTKLDALLDFMSSVFDRFESVSNVIKEAIGKELDKVNMTIEEYSTVCKNKIDESYNKLISKHQNNIGNVDKDEYESLLEDIMGGLDFDDFWESTHK